MVRTREYQQAVVEEVVLHLASFASRWAFHVSFPELMLLPLHHLRAFSKSSTVEKFRTQIKALMHVVGLCLGALAPSVYSSRNQTTFSRPRVRVNGVDGMLLAS